MTDHQTCGAATPNPLGNREGYCTCIRPAGHDGPHECQSSNPHQWVEPMFPVEPQITVVVALKHQMIDRWCALKNPPISPRSPELIRLTSYRDIERLDGVRYVEGETRVVVLGWPLLALDCESILNTLVACGFPEEEIRP